MVTVLVAGAWFESRGLAGFPELTVLSLLCVVMAAWGLPRWQESVAEHPHAAAGQALAVLPVLREKQVQWFLASLFFHILAHMGLYVFFSLYLHDLGYSKTWIGLLWAVAVVVEIVWFFTQGRWLPRLSLTGWLMLASALTSLRMGLTAVFGASLGVMLLLQCLHCITFAAHHTACVALISHYFPGRLRGRGQAIYTLVGYGLSGVLGGTLGGVLVTAFGLSSVYWACSVAALLGTYCAWRLWRLVHPDA
jgi:PPP family 3-phenylpropionic acid transporter